MITFAKFLISLFPFVIIFLLQIIAHLTGNITSSGQINREMLIMPFWTTVKIIAILPPLLLICRIMFVDLMHKKLIVNILLILLSIISILGFAARWPAMINFFAKN